MNKEEYKRQNRIPMYFLEQRNKQLLLVDEMINQIYWYDALVNKLDDKNINLKQARNKAVKIAKEYAQIDGEHHKMWVIDQMLRELLSNDYDNWLNDYNQYSRENDYKEWDCGIAP